eukprot:gene26140-biopygen14311
MNSCHEEGVRHWNRARIEAADPAIHSPLASTGYAYPGDAA